MELWLKTTYSQRGPENRFIRSLIALPFLPHADIQPAFDRLQPRANSPELKRLVGYISTNCLSNPVWLPKTWSIYQHNIRTNNDVEDDNLSGVRHVILVLSGKGGVGKSTVASQIACGLRNTGKKVGLLDVDLCGPSMPKMFNIEGNDIHQCPQGWLPVYVDKEQRLGVMSIGFLLNNAQDPIVWRGPKKNAMIKQFLSDVHWQDIDYLIIDTPPGTSDEHITVVESLRTYNPDGAILVTTPQAVAVNDVRREITFCKKSHIPVIGIIENMSGYICPNCSECSNIFSKGGGESLAKQYNVPFLGCIPLDPQLTKCSEEGRNFVDEFQQSETLSAINDLIEKLIAVDKNLP